MMSRLAQASQASNIADGPTRFSPSRFARGGSVSDHAAEMTQVPEGGGYPDPESAYGRRKGALMAGARWSCTRRHVAAASASVALRRRPAASIRRARQPATRASS